MDQLVLPKEIEPGDLVTVGELVKEAPSLFSDPAWRWYIFNAESNGLQAAIVRIGRRVYLHRPTLRRWLASGGGTKRRAA